MNDRTWADPSGFVKEEEFEHPEHCHWQLIEGLGCTRMRINRPMFFSRHRGEERHPSGDAVAPESESHSAYSLHRWGVDHVKSYKRRKVVQAPDRSGLAQDWDAVLTDRDRNIEALYELYLEVEHLNIWSGIGLYPWWLNPGFHTDLRPPSHPAYGARWIQNGEGIYLPLTWANLELCLDEWHGLREGFPEEVGS